MPTEDEIRQQQEAAKQELQTLVHSAVATHLKPLQAKIAESMKAQLAELMPAIGESIKSQFAELTKAQGGSQGAGNQGGEGGNQGGGGDASDIQKSPAFLALQRQVETQAAEMKRDKLALQEANEKAWSERTYAQTQALLQGKVKPELLDVVTDHLFKVQSLVAKHDDGSPVFKIRKAPFQGMPEEEQRLPLESGIAEWLTTKDAARFLPPPNQQGRRGAGAPSRAVGAAMEGSGPPQFSGEARTSREKNHRAMLREAALAENFPNLAKT